MRQRLSLAGQMLLLQIGIVLLVVGTLAAVSIAQTDAEFRSAEGSRLRSIAENLAVNNTVRLGLTTGVDTEALSATAESARLVSGATYVHIVDTDGILLTGPDSGTPAPLGDGTGLTGRSWIGVIDRAAPSLAAQVPVLDDTTGDLIGVIVAGIAYPTLVEQVARASSGFALYLIIGLALGVAGSLLLARRVKRQTLGLEPAEITGLVEHREAMLHGIREGVLGTDDADRITIANREASRLLGLGDDPIGRPLAEQVADPHVRRVLTGPIGGPDQVVLAADRVVVLNRQPVVIRSRRVGSVTTLRDRTELTALRRELDASRHTTDALRAQAHEFANRMHTVAGLIQLGEYDEAAGYIDRISRADLDRDLTRSVRDPAVAALLLAKSSVADERGIALRVDPASDLPPLPEALAFDLVTIVGNLVDNAVDAAGIGGGATVRFEADDDEVRVTVTDSGPGVPAALAERVFEQGYTTKDDGSGHLGLGLALARLICTRHDGDIAVAGSTFTVRLRRAT